MDIEYYGQIDNENLIHFLQLFFISYKFSCLPKATGLWTFM